ncbi:hypothetical protein D7D52_27355 [Nocardia yunnanensis]|uniref:Uncharacterized protein n=2 Tax=Nocardia yunnanensis TaxID=2382165 RepID=A0A386ZHD7_9NOCA|nr:hypothetical protein D7D52_27355 [Nocardia yunnanensis]
MEVTMSEKDWLVVRDAAECAGMTVEEYVAWSVRLLALQSRPGGARRRDFAGGRRPGRRKPARVEETEATAWADTFTERLSHRAELYHD